MAEAGLLRGLGAFNAHKEEQQRRREAAQAGKAAWFKLPKDGDHAKVRFLQELDESSPNYSEKNDLGLFALEHQSPANFMVKALCTAETGNEGECYGCDQHRFLNRTDKENYKGAWKQKRRLYINALVEYYDKKTQTYAEPVVVIFAQGDSPKQVVGDLLEYATDDHSITNREWKITRKGEGLSDTSYSLKAQKEDDVKFDVEAYEVYDLSKFIRHVPVEEQPAFYGAKAEVVEPTREPVSTASGIADDSW